MTDLSTSPLAAEIMKRSAGPARVVVTGYAQMTPLGNTKQTWQALLEGKSGVRTYDVGNFRTRVAAPVDFDAEQHFTRKELRLWPRITAISIAAAREAGALAGILDNDHRLKPEIDRFRASTCVASGIGATHYLIDIHKTIHQPGENGEEDVISGSRRVRPMDALRMLPEELNAQTAISLGCSGWGVTSTEACATGASSIVEAARLIRDGRVDVAFAGGFEDGLYHNKEVAIGIFAGMRSVLSARNEDPARASRPFDADRDGFVLGSGGGILVLESLGHAQQRGAHIWAEVLGFEKSMDGYQSTNLNVERVARTVLEALYDPEKEAFHSVDAIFAHATSTQTGDIHEMAMLNTVFGDDLRHIPITAIKSMLGHLAGGAGAVNAIAAINSLTDGQIPPIATLENIDPEIVALGEHNFVRGEPLVTDVNRALALAYGFGGYNAILLLGKYRLEAGGNGRGDPGEISDQQP